MGEDVKIYHTPTIESFVKCTDELCEYGLKKEIFELYKENTVIISCGGDNLVSHIEMVKWLNSGNEIIEYELVDRVNYVHKSMLCGLSKKQAELNYINGVDIKEVYLGESNEDYTKPQHYKNGEIDLIESWSLTYPKNEFIAGMEMIADRYVKRHRHKNGVEDLDKAIEYLERLKEYESNG